MTRMILITSLLLLFSLLGVAQRMNYCQVAMPNVRFIHKVPFVVKGKLLFIQGTIAGKNGWILIDSGSPYTLIDTHTFKNRRQVEEDICLKDLSGKTVALTSTRVSITIKTLHIKKQSVYFLNLAKLKELRNIPVIAIVGYDFLKRYELVIDYLQREITFFELNKKGNRKNKILSDNPTPL